MDKLVKLAAELLENKAVAMIIGYERGTAERIRPAFITQASETYRLIYEDTCRINLAKYLHKKDIENAGRIAIVASLPTARTIIQLASEKQIQEEKVLVLVPQSNDEDVLSFHNFKALNEYLNQLKQQYVLDDEYRQALERLQNMSMEERFEYWKKQFSRCVKCYACRAACPLCYCERCTVEINKPQWISVPSSTIGNFEWHIMRAMHMAGRCIDCDACYKACPVGIPLNIISKYLIESIKENFGNYDTSLEKQNILSSFKPGDKESFIK